VELTVVPVVLLLLDEPDDSEVTSFGVVDSPDPLLVEESLWLLPSNPPSASLLLPPPALLPVVLLLLDEPYSGE
jgi:hypothetical protein